MSIFDTVILIIWAGFVFYGFFFGLIRYIGLFFGVIIGIFVASRTYLSAYEYLKPIFLGWDSAGQVISFIIVFGIVNNLVLLGFVIIDKIFKILTIIPFLKTINRVGGAILGCLVGGMALGAVFYIASKHFLFNTLFGGWLVDSRLTPILLWFGELLEPLYPQAIKAMQGLF
ncbi:CvpA family protein [Candidatus Parcubacteria bacterium]|nr:MAG: CvpA family protein [Candidatus Parcubacteria bacterium]